MTVIINTRFSQGPAFRSQDKAIEETWNGPLGSLLGSQARYAHISSADAWVLCPKWGQSVMPRGGQRQALRGLRGCWEAGPGGTGCLKPQEAVSLPSAITAG